MNICGDSSTIELPLFQGDDGGLTPTSPLQLYFKEIEPNTAALAYSKWHYLKDTAFISTINFGAFFNYTLQGAISFGPTNATKLKGFFDEESNRRWMEIKRLVMSPLCPRNSESRFIAITIKMLRKKFLLDGLVTYADAAQGHCGTIYKASGFTAHGLTAKKLDFMVDGKIQQRGKTRGVNGTWVERSQKWLFVKDYRTTETDENIGKN